MESRENIFRIGMDIGSTTTKIAVLDRDDTLVFSLYERHNTKIYETAGDLLSSAIERLGDVVAGIHVTGSAGIGLSERLDVPFIQEVIASTDVIRRRHPETRTLIDLGGEDSKMIFFSPQKAPDIRMNGSCAGGTGAFIDQMATLLDIPVESLDYLASRYTTLYPIASRCGVFAKTDVQNLLSRKVPKEDIVASVFHAVAIQAMNTLARGFDILPKVMFSGGPFTFLSGLKKQFLMNLGLNENDAVHLDNPELLPALGAALNNTGNGHFFKLSALLSKVRDKTGKDHSAKYRLSPLFSSEREFLEWDESRMNNRVIRVPVAEYPFPECFLGIDSGSTTTKIAVTGKNGELLFGFYTGNKGNPIHAVKEGLDLFGTEISARSMPLIISRSIVTGYGEDLIKAAFGIDKGIVETIAHYTAAKYFNENVSFILDIGGQDMKAIFVKNGTISRIELNESCSSGCGSFIETFGKILGYEVDDFARLACSSVAPCDLGTRCTVFMNSKVKQSLRENASTSDIAAGLSVSVIKNALFKVLKLKDMDELGSDIVVQGGTFRNPSVHRALEELTGKNIICSNIPELMGAYGASLIARQEYETNKRDSTFDLTLINRADEYTSKQTFCKGCENNCAVTRFVFGNDREFFSGNKCEKVFVNKGDQKPEGCNLFEEKIALLYDRKMKPAGSPILRIGIPRALNVFDNFPFWNSLLTGCGFETVLSSPSSMKLYNRGQGTVMSDSICFPAKVVHGHIMDLADKKVDRIFYPMVVYETTEYRCAINTYNCPIVSGYPDVIRSSVNPEKKYGIPFDTPVVSFKDPDLLKAVLSRYFRKLGIRKEVFNAAFDTAVSQQATFKERLRERGAEVINRAISENRLLAVLAGRPYHTDRLINHKTPEILASLGVDVVPEDALPGKESLSGLHVLTQWAYPNRIYNAAQWTADQPANVQFVQMNSFGCGPDAIVIDEATAILREAGKNLTLLRIDEITSTGSVRLRLRSLIESLKRSDPSVAGIAEERTTTSLFRDADRHRTILAPVFSSVYSRFFPTLFRIDNYTLVNLPLPDKNSVDLGLKYSNNEICYPATIVIGDIIKALQSGKYNPDEIAVGITQTGGQCRASSYISLIKKGMVAAGFGHIPVISVGTGGITINEQP
ncbi:MAG: 2-hydroxyacyl-CoA dehydratase, partial [Bacteroidetes bacterium]|nr:2-hydroxyacyl-CoA dehydratase [Bacteroidota bacterium]